MFKNLKLVVKFSFNCSLICNGVCTSAPLNSLQILNSCFCLFSRTGYHFKCDKLLEC